MASLSELNRYGEAIEKLMLLRTSPIAVKMPEKESDISMKAEVFQLPYLGRLGRTLEGSKFVMLKCDLNNRSASQIS
jgi:hypothetical protein